MGYRRCLLLFDGAKKYLYNKYYRIEYLKGMGHLNTMRKLLKSKYFLLFSVLLLSLGLLCGCSADDVHISGTETTSLVEDGSYTSPEDVAEYLHIYGHLPDNFITKNEARDLGWDSQKGNLHDVAPGMSIGGDSFGNREGLLPKADGRKYYECDVNYEGGYRGGERIVYSNDGLIFYTDDHYESYEQLY